MGDTGRVHACPDGTFQRLVHNMPHVCCKAQQASLMSKTAGASCATGRADMLTHLASFIQLLVQSEVIRCIFLASKDFRCAVTGNFVLLISAVPSQCERAVESC